MSDYLMPFETITGQRQYQALDEFTQGFIEALFFSETGAPEDEALEAISFEELAPAALKKSRPTVQLLSKLTKPI